MKKTVITAATFTALDLDSLKDSPTLRAGDNDDTWLSRMIKAAQEAYENFTGRVLCQQTIDIHLDCFPAEIELLAPLSSVTSVKYYDGSNVEQTLDADEYDVDDKAFVPMIYPAYSTSWPTTYSKANAVTVRVVAGYANEQAIPEEIKAGLELWIQEQYDQVDRSEAWMMLWGGERRQPV